MVHQTVSTQTLSALLAAILTFVIGCSVLLRDHRRRQYQTFAILCFNLSLWYVTYLFGEALQLRPLQWISLVVAGAMPPTTEAFFRAFLAEDPHRPQPLSATVVVGTIVVGALLLVGLFYPIHTTLWFQLPFYIYVFASLYHCVYLIHLRQKTLSSRADATKLTYLLYGGAATIALSATNFVRAAGITLPTLGNVVGVTYIYFISQALLHYRLLDIKELPGKIVTLSALVVILSGIYALLLAWVGTSRPGIFLFNTIVASFVVLVIFEPLRNGLEDRINRWLFAARYEFATRLRTLLRDLANIIEVQPLVSRLLTALEQSGRVTHASVYLADPAGVTFHLTGHLGPPPPPELDRSTRRLLLERLQQGQALTAESLESRLIEETTQGQEAGMATRNIMQALQELLADVCIPLLSDGQVVGMLNLRDDRMRDAYASEELRLLRQVAAQAAITLQNAKVYEQLKERDRLAALGQMAAGLAHEIRNPLSAIKGATQLLKADLAGPGPASHTDSNGVTDENADDLMGIIVEEVNRLGRVVSQFLGYARPGRGQRQNLNVNDVVDRTLALVRSGDNNQKVQIVCDLAKDLPQVRADPEQLRQVFLNLVINGIQAMDNGGRLTVATRILNKPSTGLGSAMAAPATTAAAQTGGRAKPCIEVTVRDEGHGIDPDDLPNLFIPFFTTRETGTGLGLPICQRIIQEHNGQIDVESRPGRGAIFRVVLPSA